MFGERFGVCQKKGLGYQLAPLFGGFLIEYNRASQKEKIYTVLPRIRG
jgi:hypothetical protein